MSYTEQRTMFTVTLTPEAFRLARKFQNQYEDSEKQRQVYLNTLAVYAVDYYCDCMGIETDLNSCDSLDLITQSLMDVADLELTNLGKLECRPVLPEEGNCFIPSDTWSNRIGYVAVGIDESNRQATLIGFYPAVNHLEMVESISLDDFQPLSSFLDSLYRLEPVIKFLFSNDEVAVKVRERLDIEPISEIAAKLDRFYRTNKQNWRYGVGDMLANYANPEKSISVAHREDVNDPQQREFLDLAEELLEKLGKIWGDDKPDEPPVTDAPTPTDGLVDLSQCLENAQNVFKSHLQVAEYIVALIIQCQQESLQNRHITLQLYPTGDRIYLPPGIQMMVLDESGEIFLEAETGNADESLQQKFKGTPGERFSVKVALDDVSVTQDFVI